MNQQNKNAYEIRLSVLSEAIGLLMEQRNHQIEALQMEAEKSDQTYRVPPEVTAQEVLRMSGELYGFVEGTVPLTVQ